MTGEETFESYSLWRTQKEENAFSVALQVT